MQTEHAQIMYVTVRTDVERSADSDTVCHESEPDKNTSFVGIMQVKRYEASTAVNTNPIVRYSVHIVLMSSLKLYIFSLINH